MKRCFKCGAEKPLSEFYKHPKMLDGHVNKCKECNKKDVIENRLDKKDYYLNYDRNRPNHEERVASQSERTKTLYNSNPEFKEKRKLEVREFRNSNPDKYKAQTSINNALRDGKLTKLNSCEHCGTSEKKIQARHWSYEPEHWLDVIWLCTKCHGKEHKRLNELRRDPDRQTKEGINGYHPSEESKRSKPIGELNFD